MNLEKPGVSPLEQYVLLAKSARGAAAAELIKQCVEAQGVYVFGELMDMPNIQELENSTHAPYWKLLKLFAFGTMADYSANKADYPELSPIMLVKLKHLTMVSLATQSKCLPYALLLKELEIKHVRELEDLTIEAIYADIIRGKIDQKHQQLEVDFAIGRDIRKENVGQILTVLGEWCNNCESVLLDIEKQINKANSNKEAQNKIKAQTETEVTNIKKTLKSTQQQDIEEQMVTEQRELASQSDKAPVKKASKTRGLRGSAKLFGKS